LFALQKAELWAELRKELDTYQKFQDGCQVIMYGLYILNPISAIWFSKFMQASNEKTRLMRDSADAKIKQEGRPYENRPRKKKDR
jgi:hypothetical protein